MKDKIKNFFNENGCAAVIYTCVALVVVLAAGVAVYDSRTEGQGETAELSEPYEDTAVSGSKDKSYKEQSAETTTAAKTAEKPTEAVTEKTAEATTAASKLKTAEAQTETKTDDTKETASADNLFSFDENSETMLMPVEGQIVMDFSPEIAVFDPTLEQYRTTDSICIAADVGTPVGASADGVVYDAGYDEILDNFVVVDHGNGWMSTYSRLGENISAAVGDIVNAGDVIGFVGEPTDFGSALGAHLQFGLSHNDTAEDPKLLFEDEE